MSILLCPHAYFGGLDAGWHPAHCPLGPEGAFGCSARGYSSSLMFWYAMMFVVVIVVAILLSRHVFVLAQ